MAVYKKVRPIIWTLICFVVSFAKAQSPIIARIMQHDTSVVMFRSANETQFINVAAIDKRTKQLHLLTCYADDWLVVALPDDEYQQILNNQLNFFDLFKQLTHLSITLKADVRQQIYNNRKIADGWPHYASFASWFPKYHNTDSISIRNVLEINHSIALDTMYKWQTESEDPKYFSDNNLYADYNYRSEHEVYTTQDTITYYNPDNFSSIHQAVLALNKASVAYYNRDHQLIDSFALNPQKLSTFSHQDVFLFYRQWLQLLHKNITKQIKTDYAEQQNLIHSVVYRQKTYQAFSQAIQQRITLDKKIKYAEEPDMKSFRSALWEQYKSRSYYEEWMTFLHLGYHSFTFSAQRKYELTDHRGNVLATISDRRLQVTKDGVTVDHYEPDVISAQSYYAFGMEQPGLIYNTGSYRYGFNGKENDKDIEHSAQDYGMRIYDKRVGRFLSVDPLTESYPMLTPYQFSSDSPISGVDLDGKEFLGSGYLVDAVSEGAAKLGLTKTAGFISSYGHSLMPDPIYSAVNTTRHIVNQQYSSVAQDFDPTPISGAINLYQIGKKALNGDRFAQGQFLGSLPAIYGGLKGMKGAVGSDGAPVSAPPEIVENGPATNTNNQASSIHNGNPEAANANTQAQKKLQVGTYEQQKQAVGSGLSRDHIPSVDALKRAGAQAIGRRLTTDELNQLRNQSLALVYETDIHQQYSRTYGARNKPLSIADAANLLGAVKKDIDALTPALLKAGYTQTDIDNAYKQLSDKYSPPK